MTTTPNDEREALVSKIIAESEHTSRMGGITLKPAEAAGLFAKFPNPDHVVVSRALLREAADLIKETFGGIDMVRRLREAAGEGEG